MLRLILTSVLLLTLSGCVSVKWGSPTPRTTPDELMGRVGRDHDIGTHHEPYWPHRSPGDGTKVF